MSYILDALRRADAQRERDPSRGIHAQPLPPASDDEPGTRNTRRLWVASAAVLLLAAGGVAWYLMAAPGESRVALAPQAPPAAAPSPVPVAAPVMPAAAPAPAAPPATSISPPAPPPAPPAPRAPAAERNAPALAGGAAPGAGTPAPSTPPPSASPAPAAAAAASPTPASAAWPADAPKLAITGGVYSDNAAQRMLIVNAQVFNEGAEPVPGVVIEQIRPSIAVLRFRGQRYSVSF